MLSTLYLISLMLTAIAMSLALAHLIELPNKIDISAEHYLIVQRNYDNWAVIGLMVPAAFVSVVGLTIALRGTGGPFILALISLLLLVGELVAFWGFIFPMNQVAPREWQQGWQGSKRTGAGRSGDRGNHQECGGKHQGKADGGVRSAGRSHPAEDV